VELMQGPVSIPHLDRLESDVLEVESTLACHSLIEATTTELSVPGFDRAITDPIGHADDLAAGVAVCRGLLEGRLRRYPLASRGAHSLNSPLLAPQQRLYLSPLPQGHGALRPILLSRGTGAAACARARCRRARSKW
jgi:hypothetical protein